ncbi:hypothetical protein K3495_g1419 [Podosphaera aphanis]|nr:hypothetical protein K3495_g1419 [Podosphaera aphanis]
MEPSIAFFPNQQPRNYTAATATTYRKRDPLNRLCKELFDQLPHGARGHVVGVIGEFISTLMFIFLFFAGIEVANLRSNKTGLDDPSVLLYKALCGGFAFVVTAWAFFRISGGLFSPVISLGMALISAISWTRCILLCVAQTVGTIAASYMVYALFPTPFQVTTELAAGVSIAQGIIIEMLLTAQLAFTVFMLAAEKHAATNLAPIGIGLSIFIALLVGLSWTGASLNPVRTLAPCIVLDDYNPTMWIYWVGPIAGVFIAVLLFKLVKALEYETAQEAPRKIRYSIPDSANKNWAPFTPDIESTEAPILPR